MVCRGVRWHQNMGMSIQHLLQTLLTMSQTMVMELKSTPFYKPNAIAMLNTLFPPSIQHVLSAKINIEKMYRYRAEFYESIGIVEKIGSRGIDPLIEELKQGDKHSWKHVYWSLECYFDASQYM